VVGVVLLVGAAVYVLADPQTLRGFGEHVRHAPLWATLVVLVGPIFNWIFVGLCLHALMRRHGEVGRIEMLELVASAWLLNHLPLRPGLVGRIGYHAKVNAIRVRDSIEASVWSMVFAGVANAMMLGLMVLIPKDRSVGMLVLILLIPQGVYILLAAMGGMHSPKLGLLFMGLAYRNADLLVWMLRYAAAFIMLGMRITPVQIALITAVSQIAQLIPLTGGGLGTREWGVGIAAKMSSASANITMRTAIMADVINRIAETIIVIPLGLTCTAIVARRYSASSQTSGHPSSRPPLAEDQAGGDAQHQDQPGHPCQ